jgi:hypothetical protein
VDANTEYVVAISQPTQVKISRLIISNDTLASTAKYTLIVTFLEKLASTVVATLIVLEVDTNSRLLASTVKVDANSRLLASTLRRH